MFIQTANWWHQFAMLTSSRCLLGTMKMFRFCTAGLLRPGGLGQARGAEALISALGARREARVAAPRLGAPRPTLVFRVFLAAQLLSPGPLSGFRVTRRTRAVVSRELRLHSTGLASPWPSPGSTCFKFARAAASPFYSPCCIASHESYPSARRRLGPGFIALHGFTRLSRVAVATRFHSPRTDRSPASLSLPGPRSGFTRLTSSARAS